jgi:hypothetical protein
MEIQMTFHVNKYQARNMKKILFLEVCLLQMYPTGINKTSPVRYLKI